MASVFSGKAGRNASIAMNQETRAAEQRALGAIDSGTAAGLDYYSRGLGALGGLSATATGGYNQYANTLGINGAEAQRNSYDAFQNSPGYQDSVNRGLDAVQGRFASMGLNGSGNAMTALSDYAQGRQNEEFGRYQDRLSGFGNQAIGLGGQQAGIFQGIGNLYQQGGLAKAGIQQQMGQQAAQTIGQGMMAGQNAAANRMNFGMQLGSLAANALGSAAGGSGFGGMGGALQGPMPNGQTLDAATRGGGFFSGLSSLFGG